MDEETNKRKEYFREYNNRPEVKERRREYHKKRNATLKQREINRVRYQEYNSRPEVKEQSARRHRERKSNPETREADNARRREWNAERRKVDGRYRLSSNIGSRVSDALRGHKKGAKTFAHLPYSREELLVYLEQLFTAEMNWDNYGTYWHLDHIKPQASLPYDSFEHPNFVECWALQNLQPLEASENIRKSSIHEGVKYSYGDIE